MSETMMNAIFTGTFISLVFIVWNLLEKIIFNLRKEKIKNEKAIINFLKEKYTKEFPKSLKIEIIRPLKKNYEWDIYVKNDLFDLKSGRYKKESFKFSVLLNTYDDFKINKETKIKTDEYGENNGEMIYQKCLDQEGNEN